MTRVLTKLRGKILDRYFAMIFLGFGLVACFGTVWIERKITNSALKSAVEQRISSARILTRTIERDLDAGNTLLAWRQLNRGVDHRTLLCFVMLDGMGRPLVNDLDCAGELSNLKKMESWWPAGADGNTEAMISHSRTRMLVTETIDHLATDGSAGSAQVKYLYSLEDVASTLSLTHWLFRVYFIALMVISVVLFLLLRRAFGQSLSLISDGVQSILGGHEPNLKARNLMTDYFPSVRYLKGFYDEFHDNQKKLSEQVKLAAIGELASQIAHDIRSPLAALEIIGSSIQELPEEKRIMVRSAVCRIKDIANNLLAKKISEEANSISETLTSPAGRVSCLLLSSIIDEIITEKRFQFRARLGIAIDVSNDRLGYGLFANVDPVEMKRVVSNLINNSIEALGDNGAVIVALARSGDFVEIRIRDNGKGIPSEILPGLTERGVTYGKSRGSGLGLYHARLTTERWGGSLELESTEGVGTEVIIRLPFADPPNWFVKELVVPMGGLVVILDDDTSIHQIWAGRFESLHARMNDVQIFHFSVPAQLETWVHEAPDRAARAIFLVDYELLGAGDTGLDVIEKLGIQARSVLVTSRYEEAGIRDRCAVNDLKLIPKGMAGFVPISFSKPFKKADAILIDDDPLVHMMWASSAKKHGKRLELFSSPVEFMRIVSETDCATPVYIDSNLGGGEKGETFAKKLLQLGFRNIYLATGFSPDHFQQMPWVKGVIGKEPVWDGNQASSPRLGQVPLKATAPPGDRAVTIEETSFEVSLWDF